MRSLYIGALALGLLCAPDAAWARRTVLVEPNPVPVSAQKTPDEVAAAIKRVLAGRGWVVTSEQPGEIGASLHIREHDARIRVLHEAGRVRFVYAGSDNLNYEEKGGQAYIHPSYLGWLEYLRQDLTADLSGVPRAIPSAVAAEPVTHSTAPPVIRLATREERTQSFNPLLWNPVASLHSVKREADGVEQLLAQDGKRVSQRAEVAPGRYRVVIGCTATGYPMMLRGGFEETVDAKPGLEYLVECIGRTGPNIRPQITPRALGTGAAAP